MLENLELKDNIYRQKVIEYLKESRFELDKYKIKNFKDFPGAIEMIDKKGRSIVIFYNYLTENIEVIYKGLKRNALEVYISIVQFLVDRYKEKAAELEKLVVVDTIDKYHIRFKIKLEKGNNITKISPIFDIDNDLYDIYEYLESQIEELNKEV
jgi:hypothetical protein